MTSICHDRDGRRQAFRVQTLADRYPRILQRTLTVSSDSIVVEAINSLASFIAGETPLSIPTKLYDPTWLDLYQHHEGLRASEIDFLELEYLVFHQILVAHGYFEGSDDPFAGDKRVDLDTAFNGYVSVFDGIPDLGSALLVSLLGNAHDASQLHIKSNGRVLDFDPLPLNVDRDVVDIVCDNSGHEFLADLVLAAYVLKTTGSKIRLHVKAIPWFVSDVTLADAMSVFKAIESSHLRNSTLGSALCLGRESQRLEILARPHWTRPINFGEGHLAEALGTSDSMVIVKGDLNYRRCLADVSTNIFKPWRELPYRPDVPVLSLRSIKSHCWAGVPHSRWPSGLDEDCFPMDGALFCTQTIAA